MNAMTHPGFRFEATREERLLRRRLLFRLLQDFDFNAPDHHGEMITEPIRREMRAEVLEIWR